MADKKEKEEKGQQPETQAKSEGSSASVPIETKGGLMTWLILGAVVVVCSVGGFIVSSLMGRGADHASTEVQAETPVAPAEPFDPLVAKGDARKAWLYDKMDAIVANLDEPGVTRYVRVSVILEMSADMDSVNGPVFLDEKKVILQDWLTTYLAGLSLEDVRGSRNLNRIKREVLDQFNRLLFGQDKAYVEKVLFKEFAVQ